MEKLTQWCLDQSFLRAQTLERVPFADSLRPLEAVRWLSSSIACLDEDSREVAAAITDTLACLLVVRVFTDAACTSSK